MNIFVYLYKIHRWTAPIKPYMISLKGGIRMSIADEFSGLNMKDLIGGPLNAAAEAEAKLTVITAKPVRYAVANKSKTDQFVYTKKDEPE